jgi:hypothetical protein
MVFTTNELGEILNTLRIMLSKGQQFKTQKMGYWMARLAVKAEEILNAEQEAGKEICEKYCLKGQDGKPIIQNNQYQFAEGYIPDELNEHSAKKHTIDIDYFPTALENFAILNGGWDASYLKTFHKLIIEPETTASGIIRRI